MRCNLPQLDFGTALSGGSWVTQNRTQYWCSSQEPAIAEGGGGSNPEQHVKRTLINRGVYFSRKYAAVTKTCG